MGFEGLRFHNFRNLGDGELPLGSRQVFLVGANGQGKTNLLEAVHLLSVGSSFREKREVAFFRDPAQAMVLAGRYAGGERPPTALSLHMGPERRREMRVDGRLVAERRDLLAEVLCICLVPGDLEFVAGPPDERRRFIDQTLILSDLSFLDTMRGYRQVLRARNLCLRSGRDDLLDVYDEQLATKGLAIQERRTALVRDFDAVFAPLYREITGDGEGTGIRYRPAWESLAGTAAVVDHLAARRDSDRRLGITASGPHRDIVSYVRGGRDFVPYASTGQRRLCALALRVAQARFLSARTGRRPVLLLDDVLLELDPQRKRSFIERFPPYDQAFFTFLPDEGWQAYRTPDTLVLSVDHGGFGR